VILILQDAFDPKEFLAVDHHAVFLVKVRIHNHVRNSCFIFETQKDEALRCSRTLPSGNSQVSGAARGAIRDYA